MVDESTRDQQKIFALCIIFWNLKNNKQDFRVLEMKDLANCSGKLVAQAIHDTLSHYQINFQQCHICVSDNTNYMSDKTGELPSAKGIRSSSKVLDCWLHLPLSVCRLGGKYEREFARSFAYIVLGMPWLSVPSLRELCYMKFIELDIKHSVFNDFGLSDALKDPMFNYEFYEFIQEKKSLNQLFKLFDFVKNRIWYIVIHQQQLEGIFNKWNLKTHPNMTSDLQQSKLRLSSMALKEIGDNSSDLTELRIKKHQQIKSASKQSLEKENLDGNELEKNEVII
ncbi:hypothetical protein C2G38_2150669 [Gigaspora rosea]|uniref:Uncharacterized protein n=1 Tax=Gigaspora rosea TaxID=44941 RepID=A0A397TW65_9GLOM|nr:hypothetical protein C2G38_2150669 [Gigaspora rosea]